MKFLPITLITVLLASLAMALVFVPTIGALELAKPGAFDKKLVKQMSAMESGNFSDICGISGIYVKLLGRVLDHPLKRLFSLAMFVTFAAYNQYGHGKEFFPEVEPDHIMRDLRTRQSVFEKSRSCFRRRTTNS